MKKKEKLVALALTIIIIIIAAATVAAYEVISAKPGTLQIDNQISSSGSQDTTEFTIYHTWAIAWKISRPDNLFTLAVYIKSGTDYSLVTDTSETDTNTTHGILPVPNTGTFVIRVIASDATEWILIIEETT
jgi:hypothetical protein